MTEDVLVERVRPEVALVTLNRPATLNAMTPSLMRELYARLGEIGVDRTIRVVVLTGAGRGFSSGHDLADIADGIGDGDSDVVAGGMRHQQLYAEIIPRLRAVCSTRWPTSSTRRSTR